MSFTCQTCFPCLIMFLLYLCPRLRLMDRADNKHHMSLTTGGASNTVELARVKNCYFTHTIWSPFSCFRIFGYIRTHSDTFLNIFTHSDTQSHTWTSWDKLRLAWTCLDILEYTWICSDLNHLETQYKEPKARRRKTKKKE